ncbi:hypothetical protein [Knoellia koreensis]|uniref:Glycosyltransferase RgtA/B/C/D-like domain-containing protein n=1 Tax=Knoellia koreensis TaxID=2730921 RepID=A0A849HGF3_9MICO|nr:hypothetical protein [Knoellia sp. DB2414S]NNM46342.1 hypothetical protein [Knoellia sp. DB2414S]
MIDAQPRRLILLASTGLAVATAVAGIGPLSDPDAWWNLRAGQYLLATGRFDGPDPWSRFSSHDFVLTEWLGSVVAARAYDLAGPPALVWLRTLGAVVVVAVLLLTCREIAPVPTAVSGALVGLVGLSGSLAERPQTLGLALYAVSLLGWRHAALRSRAATWWMVPLTWVAAASHGYWILGIAVGLATTAGLALDDRSRDRLGHNALVLVASVAAAGLTPVGPRLLTMPFKVHGAAAGLVGEWDRASLDHPLVLISLGTIAAVCLLWVRTGTSWWQASHLALALAFTATYSRLTAPAMLLAAPLLAESLNRLLNPSRKGVDKPDPWERKAFAVAAMAVLLLGAALAPSTARDLRHTPTALAATLAAIPAGTVVFNDYNVSSWMLYHDPDLQLVIDSRLEVFSDDWVKAYSNALSAGPGWQDFVGSTDASEAVLRSDRPLVARLVNQGWLEVAAADGYLVLRKPG